jgi:hypothetical protein
LAWARRDPEAAARAHFETRVRKALDPLIFVQSITTTIGTEADSIEAADETIHGSHTGRIDVAINRDLLRGTPAREVVALLRAESDRIDDLHYGFESKNEFLQELLGGSRRQCRRSAGGGERRRDAVRIDPRPDQRPHESCLGRGRVCPRAGHGRAAATRLQDRGPDGPDSILPSGQAERYARGSPD